MKNHQRNLNELSWHSLQQGTHAAVLSAVVFELDTDSVQVYALSGGKNVFYHYAPDGDRQSRAEITDQIRSDNYAYYPKSDLVRIVGAYAYRYDENGNLLEKGDVYNENGEKVSIEQSGDYTLYEYDLLNRMVGVSKIDEGTGVLEQVVSYRYNHKNLRIERTDDEGTTRYVFDLDGSIIEEHDAEGLTRYVFRNNKHLAKITADGKTYYYGTDNLGSTTVLFDDAGNAVWKGEISAFGDVVLGEWIGEELFNERVKFTGKDYDEVTGLYYFNARWYDPQLGRFTSEDPVRDGMNWYVYVSNNPLKFVDPTGLEEAYFLYTYKDTEYDQKLKSYEGNSINDDVQRLEGSASTVAVSESTNKSDVISAFQDNEAELIVISGHGYDGDTGVQTSDRQAFSPKDLADVGIGENLKAVIFENCHQGDIKDQWQAVLGDDVEIVAWEDTMTTGETRRFNSHGMFDRQENRLSDYVGAVIDE